ncbi:MAG: Hsp20/alpha crystallin family protein [Promethearchaeota archaeon]|nr:MAG: Hsp20/alpha crystallin family protein [Candidatus Lokiarchaeota archaeon]
MSDVKDEKKIDVKQEHKATKEETKIEETPKEETKDTELSVRQRYHPLSMLRNMDRFFGDITRWFDDMFWKPSRFWDFEPFSLKVFDEDDFFRTPLANVIEDENGFHMTAELPGLEKGDLEITIHDGSLEIKGKRKEEHEEKKEGYVRREYSSSSYYRTFKVPENVDEEKIDATLEKGVLKLDLPKKTIEEKEKKKIEVK